MARYIARRKFLATLLGGAAAAKGTSALERYGRHDHLMK
jgi:hypothetical protein